MGGSTDDPPGPGRYRFGDIVVDEAAHTLLRAGEPQAVEPKAFAVLLALLRRPGELIARDDLLDQVWGHRHVTPGVLTRAIAQLRSVLGDDHHQPRYIQTRHALGYSFVGELLPEVEAEAGDAGDATDDSADVPVAKPAEEVLETHAGEPHPHRWRLRHWMAASLAALLVLAFVVWKEAREPPMPTEPSIAVMPFANLGNDRDNDYFAEGLAVEMHDALAGVDGLMVAAQLSPTAAAAREADVRALGRRLGVASVLDASVRREGGRVRINARLSDTATGYTLWSRSYDRELSDVFAIQSEIANDVAESLVGTIRSHRQTLQERLTPTKSMMAFDAYLRGLQRFRSRKGDEDAQAAIGLFRKALGEDAGMVAAQLGICRSELWRFEALRNASALDAALDACGTAERLAPDEPGVQLLMGDIDRLRGALPRARERYAVAAADPALRADVHMRYGMLRELEGDAAGALREFEAARAARPADASIIARVGYQQFLHGRIEEAIDDYRTAARLRHDDERLWSSLAGLYINAGRNDDAIAALQRSLAIQPGKEAYLNYGVVEYHAGRYREAASMLRKALLEDDGDFMVWGALADALRAEGSGDAKSAYERARTMAAAYLATTSEDAKAVAALGWYEAALGRTDEARALALDAERMRGEPGEVAVINAQTFSLIGNDAEVEERIRAALAIGVPARRMTSNPHIRKRAGAAVPTQADDDPARRRN